MPGISQPRSRLSDRRCCHDEGGEDHWQEVYRTKSDDSLSWFEQTPALSLQLIEAAHRGRGAVIDVGGGASRLAGALIEREYATVAVLDLSANALEAAKARLGAKADRIDWIVADATTWRPRRTYNIWHDRAAFHFLNDRQAQRAYVRTLRSALGPGGAAIVGTFAPDGPGRCSGLPVTCHDNGSLAAILGPDFNLLDHRHHEHRTPGGIIQKFQFSTFRFAGAVSG